MKDLITRPVFRYCVLFFLCILIGINIFSLNASLLGNHFPTAFGYGFSVISSDSMEPALTEGDLVIIKKQDSYSVGDIVAYQQGTADYVHRLIQIDGELAVTQGDANIQKDAAIVMNVIQGKVVLQVPTAGKWISLFQSPAGLLCLILLAVFLLEHSFTLEKEKKNLETDLLKEEILKLRSELN